MYSVEDALEEPEVRTEPEMTQTFGSDDQRAVYSKLLEILEEAPISKEAKKAKHFIHLLKLL